jgi:hypothetical protein
MFLQKASRTRHTSQVTAVVAKVEWHPEELYPRVGFIISNLARPAEDVVAFYDWHGRQWIKEGKARSNGPGCRCRAFAANTVRLQLHVLATTLAYGQRGSTTISFPHRRSSCPNWRA